MPIVSAFLVGVVFAVGLCVSGMTQPEKIIGFLNFFGGWDPALLFVMVGATSTYFVVYRVVRGRVPILANQFSLPTLRQIDRRLVVGAGLFGIGWAVAGYCPGPAIVSLGSGIEAAIIVVGAMLAGMVAFELFNAWLSRRR